MANVTDPAKAILFGDLPVAFGFVVLGRDPFAQPASDGVRRNFPVTRPQAGRAALRQSIGCAARILALELFGINVGLSAITVHASILRAVWKVEQGIDSDGTRDKRLS